MKKDRNCNCNSGFPAYGVQNQMMPYQGMMPNQMMMPNQGMMLPTQNMSYNQVGIEQQLNSLSNQVSNLERRVNTLENLIGNTGLNNSYNTSNFQMM